MIDEGMIRTTAGVPGGEVLSLFFSDSSLASGVTQRIYGVVYPHPGQRDCLFARRPRNGALRCRSVPEWEAVAARMISRSRDDGQEQAYVLRADRTLLGESLPDGLTKVLHPARECRPFSPFDVREREQTGWHGWELKVGRDKTRGVLHVWEAPLDERWEQSHRAAGFPPFPHYEGELVYRTCELLFTLPQAGAPLEAFSLSPGATLRGLPSVEGILSGRAWKAHPGAICSVASCAYFLPAAALAA